MMRFVLSRCAQAGLLAGVLAGAMASGTLLVASANDAGRAQTPTYFQPMQASPIGANGVWNNQPLMQVSACEPSCASPCEVFCVPSCGGCGHCGECCDDCRDDGCGETCQPSCEADCCDPCCNPRAFYVGLSGGWASREIVQEVGDPETFLTFHDGFHINFVLGRKFDWIRVEAEISRFNNRVKMSGYEDTGVENFVGRSPGNLNLTAFMFNAYHDFDIDGWRVDPYIGGGIGVCQSEINGLLPSYFQGPPLDLDDQAVNCTSDYAFAWQVRTGLNYDWSERTTLYFGYRYFQVQELTFSAYPFGTFHPNGGREHALEWGLRVAF